MIATTKIDAKEITLSAVVLRADGTVKKDLGAVAYWHRNPLRRIMWRVRQWLQS